MTRSHNQLFPVYQSQNLAIIIYTIYVIVLLVYDFIIVISLNLTTVLEKMLDSTTVSFSSYYGCPWWWTLIDISGFKKLVLYFLW